MTNPSNETKSRGRTAANDDVKPRKRGMKPRSKRNRKRACSERNSNDALVIHDSIEPLEIHGKKVPGGPPFLRIIQPYPYTFATHAKARWLNRTILDVYSTEFGSYPESYYEAAIRQGRILVSDSVVDPNYLVRGNDVLTHTVHRHEPAVAVSQSEPPYVNVVAETDKLLVIDKPSTLPIHPCGGYHQNTLMNLLEPIYGKLYTIHRLDRLTSGLVILGKTSGEAKKWGQAIKNRDARKFYLARVKGRFPLMCPDTFHCLASDGTSVIPAFGEWPNSHSNGDREKNAYGYWFTDTAGNILENTTLEDFANSKNSLDEWLEILGTSQDHRKSNNNFRWMHVCCPVRIAEPKNGVSFCGPFTDLDDDALKTVKSAQTSIALISYDADSDSSLVLCQPVTGRTHQIRLHLMHLGHSVANDPNYGGSIWYANADGENLCSQAAIMIKQAAYETTAMGRRATEETSTERITTDTPATSDEVDLISSVNQLDNEPLQNYIRRTCVWCARSNCKWEERTKLEFLVRSRGIWLHALQYDVTSGSETIRFSTPLPQWATSVSL